MATPYRYWYEHAVASKNKALQASELDLARVLAASEDQRRNTRRTPMRPFEETLIKGPFRVYSRRVATLAPRS